MHVLRRRGSLRHAGGSRVTLSRFRMAFIGLLAVACALEMWAANVVLNLAGRQKPLPRYTGPYVVSHGMLISIVLLRCSKLPVNNAMSAARILIHLMALKCQANSHHHL